MNRRTDFFADFPPMPRVLPRWNHATILILMLTLVVRLGAGLALSDKLADDPDAYAKLAENLKNFGVYGSAGYRQDPDNPEAEPKLVTRPTAYRPPLYPILLRLTAISRGELSTTRVLLLHVLMGIATTLIVWQVALRSGLGAWSMVAVAVTLLDPILINQSALVMTETLATLLAAACLWALWARKQYLCRRYGPLLEDEATSDEATSDEATSDEATSDEAESGRQIPQAQQAQQGPSEERAEQGERAADRRRRASPHVRLMRRLENNWLLWIRFDILAGSLLGLAILCRPTFLAWLGLLVIVEVVRNLYHDRYQAIGHSVAMCLVVGLVLAPWTWRNAEVIGKMTPTTTHGGYTLLLGNNPDFYRFLNESSPGATWDPSQLDADRRQFIRRNELTEVESDQDSYGRALEAISDDPRSFLYSCYIRLGRFWSPMPHKGTVRLAPSAARQDAPEPSPEASTVEETSSEKAQPLDEAPKREDAARPPPDSATRVESGKEKLLRWGTCAWYDTMMVLVLVGITVVWRRRLNGPWVEGFLLAVALSLVHTVFWSNMRMRAPLTPFLSLLVAAGLTLICSREDDLEGTPSAH